MRNDTSTEAPTALLPMTTRRPRLHASTIALVAFAGLSLAGAQTEGLSASNFDSVKDKIITYFGYGVTALIAVMVVTVAGRVGLNFLKSLFQKS